MKNNGNATLKTPLRRQVKKYYKLFPFLVPGILLVLLFSYIPMVGTLFAFKDKMNLIRYDLFDAFFRANWTFSNFVLMFSDSIFILAIKNTLIINFAKLLIVFPLTIILALFLNEIKNRIVVLIVLIVLCLPNFLSWSVTAAMWRGFLDPTAGAVNNIMLALGMVEEPIWFFGSNTMFKPLVVFLAVWKGLGWSSIIFYTAIVAIDKTFYEAALIDGASKFGIMTRITIPMILPTIALMLVMNITYFLDAGFEQVYAMAAGNGTIYEEQQILGTYLYDISVAESGKETMATAMGVFNGAVALILMLSGNSLVKKTLNKSLW